MFEEVIVFVVGGIIAFVAGVVLYMYLNGDFEPKNREYRYEWGQNQSDNGNYFVIMAKDREEADAKAREFSKKLAVSETMVSGEFLPIN